MMNLTATFVNRFSAQLKQISLEYKHTVILLTLIAAFLRFYNLPGTLQFLGDQGRDALVAHRMLIERDLVFIGPVTSVGNMYLGPWYYYFSAPFYALTYPSPMGPVYAVAFLGTLTVPLIYLLGQQLVGKKAALFAAVIFTFSHVFIELSRFSWNPNPAPFISMIMIWATYKALLKNSKYWILVSLTFSILVQLHYLTLLSLVSAGIIWLTQLTQIIKSSNDQLGRFVVHTILAVLLFLLSLTPLILFDLRHQFLNVRAFGELLFGEEEQIKASTTSFQTVQETLGRSLHILFELTTSNVRPLNIFLVSVVWAVIIKILISFKKRVFFRGEFVLIVWLMIGVSGTALYRSTVFDHYLGYLFPVTSLILGMVLAEFWKHLSGKIMVAAFYGWFFFSNLSAYNFGTLGWTIEDIAWVSQIITTQLKPEEKYSVVLLAPHRDLYGMNYRYYLTVGQVPPLNELAFADADTLVIIDEEKLPRDVTNLPIYEIQTFPNKQVNEKISIQDGPDIYILRR